MKQKTVNRITNVIEEEHGFSIEIISMTSEGNPNKRGQTITVVYVPTGSRNIKNAQSVAIVELGRRRDHRRSTSRCTHKMSRDLLISNMTTLSNTISNRLLDGKGMRAIIDSTISDLKLLIKEAGERKE